MRSLKRRARESRARARAFTIVELLIVIVIMSSLALIAYAGLKTFSDPASDAGVATQISRTINRARDQARRRNRVMIVRFDKFATDAPGGTIEYREGNSGRCLTVARDIAARSERQVLVPFGQTRNDAYVGDVVKKVGLRGWLRSDQDLDDAVTGKLDLCAAPDGSISRVLGQGGVQPIAGRLQVLVQRYINRGQNNNAFQRTGPPRRVELSFGGGARLALN